MATTQFEPRLMQDVAREALVQHLGTLPVGQRLPPIKDLARQLGLGQSNLHEAMRELARQGVVYSRPRLGTFLAKPMDPASAASPSPAGATQPLRGKLVKLCSYAIVDEAVMGIVRGAEQVLKSLGATVQQSLDASLDLINSVAQSDGDLLILVNPSSRHRPELMALLASRPCVLASVSWHSRSVARVPCDLVGVDQHSGAALAGEALRHSGCRQACFLGRRIDGQYDGVSRLRLEGLEAGLGRTLPPPHCLDAEGYSVQAGTRAFRRWMELPDRPTGVFAVSDDVAVGFYAAALGQGLRPREDFHLVGFDGLAIGQNGPEPLTTVQVPFQQMGQTAAELALNRLTQPQRPIQITYLGCQLLPGATAQFRSPNPPRSGTIQ